MPCVKSGARAGSLYRNLVAHALTLGASGDRAPVRQQPWTTSRSCEAVSGFHNVTFGPGGKAIISCSVFR